MSMELLTQQHARFLESQQMAISQARKISARLKPSRKWEPLKKYAVTKLPLPDKRWWPVESWQNSLYDVTARRFDNGWPFGGGPYAQIGISCVDGEPRHDWRDMQRIKNDVCGDTWEAIELYPSEDRLLDPSNYYILWAAPAIQIGMHEGRTLATPENCIAPQRGWAKGDEPKE